MEHSYRHSFSAKTWSELDFCLRNSENNVNYQAPFTHQLGKVACTKVSIPRLLLYIWQTDKKVQLNIQNLLICSMLCDIQFSSKSIVHI